MGVSIILYAFIIIFLLNLIPIFGPPTWTVLSFISFTYPIPNLPLFILVALCASTSGRLVLTLSSKHILRNRLLSKKYYKNMEVLRKSIEKKPHFASIIFFVEAFTPLPSDQFFIAYGLTGMKLRYAFVPFFIARIFTYSFWVYVASGISKGITTNALSNLTFLSWPAIIIELLVLLFVYYFVKIDWQHLIFKHKLRILRYSK